MSIANSNDDEELVERRRFASPACAMPEVHFEHIEPLSERQLLGLLNLLLEGERAGARGIIETCLPSALGPEQVALRAVAGDEGRFCTMLYRHIVRLGGEPSTGTGDFLSKLADVKEFDERLELLNRGQGWVVRKLRESLPRIEDAALHADLIDMLVVHEQNITLCDELLSDRS